MSRRRRWVVVLASVGAVVLVSVALVLLYVPEEGASSGLQAVGFRVYSFETVSLFGDVPNWQNYTYRGVTFEFHLWCEITPAAGVICGNATESGGAEYPFSFSDGPPQSNPPWQTWVSPDGHEAVQYRQGGTAHLLVVT